MAASKAKKNAKGNKAGNEARGDKRRKKRAGAAARSERGPAASLAKRAKKVVGESVKKAARVAKRAVAGAKQGVEKGASRIVERASAAKRGASKKASKVGKDALAVKATVGKKVQGVARQAGRAAEAVIERARPAKPVKPVKQVKQMKQVKPEAKAAGEIAVGSVAPAFELPDQAGNLVSSESLRGQPYVLYFYPKDDTPGCTTEACGFRDFGPRFGKTGVRVIGVSPDSEKSHARFAEKYGLPFTLLSDADKSLAHAYGVWIEKQNYGRTYMGIDRSTFLIDAEGRVQKVWRRVRVPGHVDAVLEAATAL